jgi:23S rRNA (uracil1939-C5)-methyltransferase
VSETFDLRIDSIAAGGDGVGRHNGMVVFVPRTATGDLARVTAERHGRLMRGRLDELLEASRHRADPPCKHYVLDRCGGCQLQHLRYETQLDAKATIVRDALERIGRLRVETPRIEATDKPWRYRRKLTLALRRRDDRWIAGLHRYDTLDVFPLEDCLITEQPVVQAWARIVEQQHLLPLASELRGAVRLLDPGFSFTVEGGREWTRRAELFQAIPEMVELWWKPEEKSRRLLESRTGDRAGASFVQVNPGVAEQLRAWVIARALAVRPETAIDAYAGTGDIAVALAEQGTRVVAIEIDRDAARVAASRLHKDSRAVAASVETALRKALPADVVILNPPRAGLEGAVTDMLRAQTPKPKAVVYVSCNPATLARDIRRLETYRVQSVRAFDMFPQTAHVETVCELLPAEHDA